jgi:hypothetical protein
MVRLHIQGQSSAWVPPQKAISEAIYFGKSALPQGPFDLIGVSDYFAFFE